jgi:hypothetical protein
MVAEGQVDLCSDCKLRRAKHCRSVKLYGQIRHEHVCGVCRQRNIEAAASMRHWGWADQCPGPARIAAYYGISEQEMADARVSGPPPPRVQRAARA